MGLMQKPAKSRLRNTNQNKIRFFPNFLEYILVYLILGFSVIPFFSSKEYFLAGLTAILILFSVLRNKIIINKLYFAFFVLLFLVLIIQSINFGYLDLRAITGTTVRFFFPFLVVIILKERFIPKLINTVYVLTVIGLIFWVFKNIFPDINNAIVNFAKNSPFDEESGQNFLIYSSRYTIRFGSILSNSGFAYEPGAYSIILAIALILNTLQTYKLLNKKNVVFIIAFITTFSTAGYIGLFVILMGYSFETFRLNKFIGVFLISTIILIGYLSLTSAEFLGKKIKSQIELTSKPGTAAGRFASGVADLRTWSKNPLFGTGKSAETYLESAHELGYKIDHRVNGLANFLAKFGILFWSFYLFLIYFSLQKYSQVHYNIKKAIPFYWLALLTLAFSQICMQWAVVIALIYFPLVLYRRIVIPEQIRQTDNYLKSPSTIYSIKKV